MCPGRARECFVSGGTLAGGSNDHLRKPAFAAGAESGRVGLEGAAETTEVAH